LSRGAGKRRAPHQPPLGHQSRTLSIFRCTRLRRRGSFPFQVPDHPLPASTVGWSEVLLPEGDNLQVPGGSFNQDNTGSIYRPPSVQKKCYLSPSHFVYFGISQVRLPLTLFNRPGSKRQGLPFLRMLKSIGSRRRVEPSRPS